MTRAGRLAAIVDISGFTSKLEQAKRRLVDPRACAHRMNPGVVACLQPVIVPEHDRCYYHRKKARGLI